MLKLVNNKNNYFNIHNYCNTLQITKTATFNAYIQNILDITYQGKTYKWKIKKNLLKLIFNRAHKTWIFIKNCKLKNMSKTKIRMFTYNKFVEKKLLNIFLKIRKNNIFTQRGIKIKNKYIYKKRGKISTYKKC